MNCLFHRAIKALAFTAVAACSTAVQASESWGGLQIVDMTTAPALGGDLIVTTGFLHDLDLVDFHTPTPRIADRGISYVAEDGEASGWAGIVEVEMDQDPRLPFEDITSFSDTFADTDRETRMSGFYTMRYQFAADLPFRPYAGAGVGLVATDGGTEAGGILAGRATAGFDLTVGSESAIFAEYAFVKSGGVGLGMTSDSAAMASAVPDSEHSLKLGFRRTF